MLKFRVLSRCPRLSQLRPRELAADRERIGSTHSARPTIHSGQRPGGIFAPTIRYHAQRFWIITTNVNLGRHLIVTATDPAGPWSDPTYVDVPGVDPSLVWDDDGACWLTVSGVDNYLIDPDSGTVLHGPVPMWSGTGGQSPEAPHLYHIGDWWYLLVSEGGTHTGHAVSVARSRTPSGPFEPGPANPILTHRGTDRPIQATGHADLFEAHDGTWWLVLLGIRPRGQWPTYHVLGRETFLDRYDGPTVGLWLTRLNPSSPRTPVLRPQSHQPEADSNATTLKVPRSCRAGFRRAPGRRRRGH